MHVSSTARWCDWCGEDLPGWDKGRYCSYVCEAEALYEDSARWCLWCDADLPPMSGRQFCGRQCQAHYLCEIGAH